MIPAAFAAAAVVGGLAAVARYLVTRAFGATSFPWAVLLVNVLGSAVGGVVLGLAVEGAIVPGSELIVLGGVAGGLTTFSTFAVDTVQLATGRRWWEAVGNILGSFILGIAAVVVGFGAAALLL